MSKKTETAGRYPTATIMFSTQEEKEHYRSIAESYGLNLSAYLKMSAMEYYRQHPWNTGQK